MSLTTHHQFHMLASEGLGFRLAQGGPNGILAAMCGGGGDRGPAFWLGSVSARMHYQWFAEPISRKYF